MTAFQKLCKLLLFILNYAPERYQDRRGMVEMDRFTRALEGRKEEVIERQSVESAATMKLPVTVDKCTLNSYLLNHIKSFT